MLRLNIPAATGYRWCYTPWLHAALSANQLLPFYPVGLSVPRPFAAAHPRARRTARAPARRYFPT
eukprot:14962-Pelagococcus_subviridis.AAC.3